MFDSCVILLPAARSFDDGALPKRPLECQARNTRHSQHSQARKVQWYAHVYRLISEDVALCEFPDASSMEVAVTMCGRPQEGPDGI